MNLQPTEYETMGSKIAVALIHGNTRDGRFCDTLGRWAAEQIAGIDQFISEVIDPAAPSPQPRRESRENPHSPSSHHHITDAFVVVTPEYNHGHPAPLTALIDSVGQRKPAAFVTYRGITGGLGAVEQQLRWFLRNCR
jgi:NAD(P)H-dependent FMN reductase